MAVQGHASRKRIRNPGMENSWHDLVMRRKWFPLSCRGTLIAILLEEKTDGKHSEMQCQACRPIIQNQTRQKICHLLLAKITREFRVDL
jgi:hypothetical protein